MGVAVVTWPWGLTLSALVLTSKARGKANRAVGRLNLYQEGSQDVDAPAGSGLLVLVPFRAGSRDVAVDEPLSIG